MAPTRGLRGELERITRVLVAATGRPAFIEGQVVSAEVAAAHAGPLRTSFVRTFRELAEASSAEAAAFLSTWRSFAARAGLDVDALEAEIPGPPAAAPLSAELRAVLDRTAGVRFGTPARPVEIAAAGRDLEVAIPEPIAVVARACGAIVMRASGVAMPVFELAPVACWETDEATPPQLVAVRLGTAGNIERVACQETAGALVWTDERGRSRAIALVDLLAGAASATGVVEARGSFPEDLWDGLFDV